MVTTDTTTCGIGIVVSWRDRPELGRVLPSLTRCADRYRGDVTIVNYGGDCAQLSALLRDAAPLVTVVTVRDQRWFNKARAQNIGAAHSRSDLLFFCDCDILVEDGALDELVARVSADIKTFGTVAEVTETELNARRAGNVVMFGYHLKIRIANGRTLQIIDNEEDAEDGTRQAPGLLITHRESFERLGGYNGRLHGWGWEDQDMIARLTLGEGLVRIESGQVKHISHDDSARIRHYPAVRDRWESRDRMFRQALANYDRGDFAGTLAADLAELGEVCRACKSSPSRAEASGNLGTTGTIVS
jgi:glycosyltransferase involved in cell wall biosynthesis